MSSQLRWVIRTINVVTRAIVYSCLFIYTVRLLPVTLVSKSVRAYFSFLSFLESPKNVNFYIFFNLLHTLYRTLFQMFGWVNICYNIRHNPLLIFICKREVVNSWKAHLHIRILQHKWVIIIVNETLWWRERRSFLFFFFFSSCSCRILLVNNDTHKDVCNRLFGLPVNRRRSTTCHCVALLPAASRDTSAGTRSRSEVDRLWI